MKIHRNLGPEDMVISKYRPSEQGNSLLITMHTEV